MKDRIEKVCRAHVEGFVSDKRLQELIHGLTYELAEENKVDVVCMRCGTINDFRTEKSGPHIKAICNGCDKYIKFLKQTPIKQKEEIMADKVIKGRINVNEIVKAWLYKGEKGTYLDFTILYNENADSYGNNGMIVADVPREIYKKEVEDKLPKDKMTKGPILGNVKNAENLSKKESTPGYRGPETSSQQGASAAEADDDLPF